MKLFLSLTAGALLLTSQAIAQTISITYGSKFDDQTALFYADQWGQRLTTQNPGIIAVGYFDDGFDPLAASQNLNANGITPILDAFNALDSKSSIEAQTDTGYIVGGKEVAEQGVGKTAYILQLAGVSSIDQASASTGIGLYTDSTFPTIPNGATPIPIDYEVDALFYDQILLGSPESTTDPSAGTVFIPLSIGVPPFVLSTSQRLSDNWWTSTWFGIFATHSNSNWIYHHSYGWVYPDSTHSTGLWFYEPTQYGWLFTSSTTYPNIWSDSMQKWLYLNEESPSLSFWMWNSDSSTWELP